MKRPVLFVVGGVLLVASAACFLAFFLGRPDPGRIGMRIEVKPAVMTAAYKVYANRTAGDGRYWLTKTILKNDGGRPLKNVSTSYQVPGLIGWTTPRTYPEVLPGQTIVSLFYPHFPDSVASKTTNTTEVVELRVEYDGVTGRQQETRQVEFQMRGRNDMIYTTLPASELVNPHDYYENTDLFAVFVTPDDPVIKYFVQELEQRVMGGTTVGAGADVQEVGRFMKAVYSYWVASGIVYAGTEGLPEKVGETVTSIQHVRLPREVLTGKAGLCIELAALYSTIAEAAGLEPVIVTTANHAFPAIKVGGDLVAIEATAIGTPGMGEDSGPMSFGSAQRLGDAELSAWMQGGGDVVIDGHKVGELAIPIAAYDIADLHSKGIVPPELPDDAALKQKIDDTFDQLLSRSGGRQASAGSTSRPQVAAEAAQARDSAPGNAYNDPGGRYSIVIPAGWQAAVQPNPATPWVALQAMDPGTGIGLEVYVFEGVASVQAVMDHIQAGVASMGGVMQYTPLGSASLGGRSFQLFTGGTAFPSAGRATDWDAYVRAAGNRTYVLSLGTTPGRLAAARPVLRQVAGTFRVRG
ncbi:MAG TPA: hypothetical protein PK163_03655 [Steroidobacteraceae bacterium]|nr:hypothetical protein [Steroidobacteraceae bacterium]